MRIGLLQGKRIERFAWYDSWLARGGQPSAYGLEALKAQGVGIVVNLRERDERKAVEHANLRAVHIPVKNDCAPSHEQLLQWLRLCADNYHTLPIFVHCKGGEGRTSTFCAAVRIAQGWSVSDAIADQRRFNFEPEGKHAAQARALVTFADGIAAGTLVIPAMPPPMSRG